MCACRPQTTAGEAVAGLVFLLSPKGQGGQEMLMEREDVGQRILEHARGPVQHTEEVKEAVKALEEWQQRDKAFNKGLPDSLAGAKEVLRVLG